MNTDEIKKFVRDYLGRVLGNNTTSTHIEGSFINTMQVNIIDKVTNKSHAFYLSREFIEVNTMAKVYIYTADKLIDVCREIQKTRLSALFPKGIPTDLLVQQKRKEKPVTEAYEGPSVIVHANHTITVYSAGKKLDATFKPKKDITAYQLSVAMFLLNGDYLGSALEMIAESDMIEHWEIQE